jgi:hypothetical protein
LGGGTVSLLAVILTWEITKAKCYRSYADWLQQKLPSMVFCGDFVNMFEKKSIAQKQKARPDLTERAPANN